MTDVGGASSTLAARLRTAFDEDMSAFMSLIWGLFDDRVEMWHNFESEHDGVFDRDVLIAQMAGESTAFSSASGPGSGSGSRSGAGPGPSEQQLIVADEAVVHSMVMNLTLPDGATFRFPTCVIYRRNEAGRITRLEGWYDSACLPKLMAAFGASPAQ